jgi:hypothetical protein
MRARALVTLTASMLTAVAGAILVTGEPAQAKQPGSWMCGPVEQMGCFAGGSSTCHLGSSRVENGILICDPSGSGVTDCCKQVNAE